MLPLCEALSHSSQRYQLTLIVTLITSPETLKHKITLSKTTESVAELGLEPCLILNLRRSLLLSASPEREEATGMELERRNQRQILMFD